MSHETTLTDIIARLRQGRFPEEQAISQGNVLPVIRRGKASPHHNTGAVLHFGGNCNMDLLTEQQRKRALEAMQEYLSAPADENGKTPAEKGADLDKKRIALIEKELKPLLAGYLSGKIPLSDFKSMVDGINKRNELWGFRGIKGQMFFNMVQNVADDPGECDQELKSALTMPANEHSLVEAAKRSGTSLERAFEKFIDAAFTIMEYETKLLGQGQGRVPDGRAVAPDDSYAILWDGKVRANAYSMGTDDRIIREYVTTQSRELSRRFRNIYYAIISSAFVDDFDEAISSMKMETDVSEVVLLTADAIVAIVDAKLRSPLEVTLGPDGIQRLFTQSGVLTAEMVREYLV
jgi:hypothetical protein